MIIVAHAGAGTAGAVGNVTWNGVAIPTFGSDVAADHAHGNANGVDYMDIMKGGTLDFYMA